MKTKVPSLTALPPHHSTGFYYHYKHDPARGIFDHAYLILGVGVHTEDKIEPEDQVMQVYYPLDPESFVYLLGSAADLRPNAMAMEEIEIGGKKIPRFRHVTDQELIKQFKERLREMYPQTAECFAD